MVAPMRVPLPAPPAAPRPAQRPAQRPGLALGLALALSACAAFPEVDRAGAPYDRAQPPRLLPTATVLAAEGADLSGPDTNAALLARAAALRARADGLRRPPPG